MLVLLLYHRHSAVDICITYLIFVRIAEINDKFMVQVSCDCFLNTQPFPTHPQVSLEHVHTHSSLSFPSTGR